MSTNKFEVNLKKADFIFVLTSFLIWRLATLIIAFFAIKFIPLFSHNYLGGGFSTYSTNPLFWSNLNFDGEHYLAIAQNGYQPLEYFFFPLFPYLIKILSIFKDLNSIAWTGLLISNVSFFITLIGIYKLVKLDFKANIAKLTVILLLIFPTSFYFGAYYTESIFLGLIVWSFYSARKGNFFVASLIAALASATRIIGVVMFPVLLIEYLLHYKNTLSQIRSSLFAILISPLGLLAYMFFLLKQTGDPLIFLHQVSIFGTQRSSTLILLPQVIYRYLFKILPFVNYLYFPNVFTTYLEFLVAIIFLVLILFTLFKLRISYFVYAILAYLIPTLAGSFSSMPRYALAIFPVFIFLALLLNKLPRFYKYIFLSVMLILLAVSLALFVRGYWIS